MKKIHDTFYMNDDETIEFIYQEDDKLIYIESEGDQIVFREEDIIALENFLELIKSFRRK